MKNRTLKDIQQELGNITYAMYKDELEILSSMPDHVIRDMIFEMASFLFGDYEEEYSRLISERRNKSLTKDEMYIEHLTFFTLVTDQVFKKIKEKIVEIKNK